MPFRPVLVWLAVLTVAASSPGQPVNPLTQPPESVVTAPPAGDGPRGTLIIRGVQCTQGAPEVSAGEVTVEFVRRDQVVHRMETKLDDHGMVVINDLPLDLGVRPLVRIKHAGVQYQEIGPALDAAHANIAMDVKVYETTDEAPEWRVAMRHIRVQPIASGLGVSEMVVVENPADRTWLGGMADAEGRRPVVQLSLPEQARDVRLESGFHGWCCTQFVGRELTVQMPLMPGRASYRFSYIVPMADARGDLQFAARGQCDHALVLVPQDAIDVEPLGVEAAPPDAVKDMPGVRVYQASHVAKGAFFGVSMGMSSPGSDQATEPRPASRTMLVVGSAAIVIVIITGVFLLRRRSCAAAAPKTLGSEQAM